MARKKRIRMGDGEPSHIHGHRFDADLSRSRERVDIKDMDRGTMLTMLDVNDVVELATIAGEAQARASWSEVPTSRFRPTGHMDRDGVDIFDRRDLKRFGALDGPALEELQLLALELVNIMTGR